MKMLKRVLPMTGVMSALTIGSCFAVENPGLIAATTAITSASTDLIAAGGPVITAGIGIGVVFFGAKLLWGKFRSMAK